MVPCPTCGTENPDGFRFCPSCGGQLGEAPATVPPRTERRVVTVLFCDLVGFTARSDSADPEDVRATLVPFHAIARREIERHGGTLDKFIGDAAMGVFGSPVAHEDDAERAVRTALGIVDAVREHNAAGAVPPLEVRVGLDTGEALVTLAAGVQEGENVAGDVVNVASRLQSVAPVGGVVVGERTVRAARQAVAFEELPAVTVKGKAEPIPIWRAIGVVVPGAGSERRTEEPFVGRAPELARLTDGIAATAGGSGVRMVTIVGEPGVGKTRLVAEARSAIERRFPALVWRVGRCLPYGEGIAFWAIGEIVKAEAGIRESDPVERRDSLLGAMLERLTADPSERAWLHARVAPLVGLGSGSLVDREESFAAWRRLFAAIATDRPTVAVVEDLHWADRAALSFLDGLADHVGEVPFALVATARPELFDLYPAWASTAAGNADTIRLAPLDGADTSRLVAGLLDRATLPAETRSFVVERSGGNPLYAGELSRMLRDRELVDAGGRFTTEIGRLALPDTVQALLAARLDTLPAERRSVLQDASVIGSVFWSGAVARLGSREDAGVVADLAVLTDRAFVRAADASAIEGQSEYAFSHQLARDVTYGQIPRAERARKHRAAAEWIEEVMADRASDLAEILAYHGTQALDLARAAGAIDDADVEALEGSARRYLHAAGVFAMSLDVARAEGHLRRALELTPPGHPDHASIEARLAEAAFQAGRHDEAEERYRSAIDGLHAQGRAAEAADAMIRLSVVVEYRGGPAEGRAILAEAIATLERLPPGPELARAFAESAGTAMVSTRFSECIADAERAIELAGAMGEAEAEARAHNFRGYARVALGDVDGLTELRASVETTRTLGLGRATAVSYSNLGAALYMVEGPQASLDCGREGAAFADARGLDEMSAFLRNGMLTTLVALGRWDEVLRLGARVAEDAKRAGAEYEEVYAELDRLNVRINRGEPGVLELAEALLARARPIEDPPLLAWALTNAAQARLAIGDREGAAALVAETIEVTQGEAVVQRAAEGGDLVRVAVSTGRVDLAARAMEGLDALPLPRHRYALLAARAELLEADGRLEEAARLHEEAASRWESFGHVPERGHALFGAGRCLARLGRAGDARARLLDAREVFAGLGAAPLLAQVDALL